MYTLAFLGLLALASGKSVEPAWQTIAAMERVWGLDAVGTNKKEASLEDLKGLPTPLSQHVPVQAPLHPDPLFVLPDMALALGREVNAGIEIVHPKMKVPNPKPAICLGFALGEPPVFPGIFEPSRSLRDGYLPIVTSRWTCGDIVMEQTAFGALPDDKAVVTGKETQYLAVRLILTNTSKKEAKTVLTIAPGLALATQCANYTSYTTPSKRWNSATWDTSYKKDALMLDGRILAVIKTDPSCAPSFGSDISRGAIRDPLRFSVALASGKRQTIDLVVAGSSRLADSSELSRMRAIRFDKALARAEALHQKYLHLGMKLSTPDSRINDVYRGLILSCLETLAMNPEKGWCEPYQSPVWAMAWPWEFAHMTVPLCGLGYGPLLDPAFRFFTDRQNEVGPSQRGGKGTRGIRYPSGDRFTDRPFPG